MQKYLQDIGILVLIAFAREIALTEIYEILNHFGFQVIFYAFTIVLFLMRPFRPL